MTNPTQLSTTVQIAERLLITQTRDVDAMRRLTEQVAAINRKTREDAEALRKFREAIEGFNPIREKENE